ncbi:hypothetical protein ABPG75_005583 [Micractinium tetrahymenae]
MIRLLLLAAALGAVCLATCTAAAAARTEASALRSDSTPLEPRPSAANCTELFFEQPLDQSDYNEQPIWLQRYFVCNQFLRQDEPAPTILFYVGNEGKVTNAVNNLGLLWELAAEWNALLVWAEHRYYGDSQPVNGTLDTAPDYRFLSVEQALVDYVKLIQHLRDEYGGPRSPVVAFGASYGAMLAAWLRYKYPITVQAALASSAPLRSTLVDGQGWDPSTFWQVVTRAASPAGGCPPGCERTVRAAFAALFNLSSTPEGQAAAAGQLRLCDDTLLAQGGAPLVALSLMMAFDTAAMGSVPYEFYYFTGDPDYPLPPWPMRAMCDAMGAVTEQSNPKELLGALAEAVAIVNNVTGVYSCYTDEDVFSIAMQTSSPYSGSAFTYQVCAQFVPSESFFPPNGATDMFWDARGFNASWVRSFCRQQFGQEGPVPDFRTLPLLFGATAADFQAGASNILFSNGLLDPWSSGGFLTNLSDSMPSLIIAEAGHHVDLYWADPADLSSYGAVRAQERQILAQWVDTWRRSGGG